jgi:integrase
MKLTDRTVAALVRPAKKDDVVIWDDDLPGFGVRLRGDHKAYLIQFRVGPLQRRESLGDTRRTRLEDARKAARQRFAKAQLGIDPAAERERVRAKAAAARLTLGAVAERYLAAKQNKLRPSSHRSASMYFSDHWSPLRNYSLDSIRRADVAALLQDIAKDRGSVTAGRARANLAALFAWATREGLYEGANPVAATNDPAAGLRHRDRVLSEAELATIWRACEDDAFGRIVRLLMLLGARRAEIGGLKWRSEVDFDRGTVTIAGERTKNHRALTLALPPLALDILRSVPRHDGSDSVFTAAGNGFSSWSSQTRALKDRIRTATGKPLPAWTLHDIRRSVATHMAEIGVQPHIIEAILNHVSGHKRGVAGIYNQASYRGEIATALLRWSEHLTAIIAGRKSKVVSLRA